MTQALFRVICFEIVTELRKYAPKDTGNLAYNSIRCVFLSEKVCKIYVNQSIAPYMIFTNEIWITKRNRYGQIKNPNEHWFNKAIELIMEKIAFKYGGILKNGTQPT